MTLSDLLAEQARLRAELEAHRVFEYHGFGLHEECQPQECEYQAATRMLGCGEG